MVPRSIVGKGGKFRDSIPVADCPADAKFIFKESISKARPCHQIGSMSINCLPVEANSLWACYGSLQRLHVLPVWSGLEKHDDEVGGDLHPSVDKLPGAGGESEKIENGDFG